MLVSVIITTYNYGRYLGRAIRSIHNQSLDPQSYEIIVVNDASTDHTHQVLEDYKDIIKIINLEKNVGLSEARNLGIRHAIGQFIVFVDADDYVHRDLLKVQSMFLEENPKIGAVSADYILVDDFGEYQKRVSAEEKPIACGIMFRKDLLYDIGLYDKKFKAREDEDLRIRFLKKHSIYNIILPLYRYRKHDSNLTKNKKEMTRYSRMLKRKHKDGRK